MKQFVTTMQYVFAAMGGAIGAVRHIVDTQIICDGSVVRTAVIFFYLSNEGISILENATRIGLPVPQKLKNVLEQLKEDDEEHRE